MSNISQAQLHRPRTAQEGRHRSDVVLDPLPPPREDPLPLDEKEEEDIHTTARLRLLETRLKLMEYASRASTAPAGSLQAVRAHRKSARQPQRPRRQSPQYSPKRHQSPERNAGSDAGRATRAYGGTWGELNPFDPVQNPRAHRILQERERAATASPERGQRSQSLGASALENFRPS